MNAAGQGADRLLRDILEISFSMRESARAAEWETLQKQEEERGKLIRRCFSTPPVFSDNGLAAKSIRRIIELNREVIELGTEGRKAIGRKLGKLNQGRHAVEAYKKCG